VPSSEQYAQLAALFTTGVDADTRPFIELLLLAHLPVQGGLWLVPYAGREAGNGLSMLIRMQSDTLDVAAIGRGSFDLSECTSIDEVLQIINEPVNHWIIQPPPDTDPTSLLHCDSDSITLLSGADQAAVVGAYRLLKGLISVVDNSDQPTIQLVIVGAEEHSANDAASRIVHTAHHQLGIQVEVGHPLPAMGSSNNIISQVSFSRRNSIVDLFCRLRSATDSSDELPTLQEAETIESPVPIGHVEADGRGDLESGWDISGSTRRSENDEHVASVSIPQEPIGVQEPNQDDHADVQVSQEKTKRSLTSHVEGLLEITPRCPDYEHVELAVDGEGGLHLLADVQHIRDVVIVAGWLIRHHALIAMACGGIQLSAENVSVQHLFTNDAVAVADLQGTGVQLHLLTEVVVSGNTGWYCTPLN